MQPETNHRKDVQAKPKRLPSESLFGERREVIIVHNGREDRLRHTQNGKLILTA
jgi:hemin uptake protein HemP